jgi:hypothetical protein
VTGWPGVEISIGVVALGPLEPATDREVLRAAQRLQALAQA